MAKIAQIGGNHCDPPPPQSTYSRGATIIVYRTACRHDSGQEVGECSVYGRCDRTALNLHSTNIPLLLVCSTGCEINVQLRTHGRLMKNLAMQLTRSHQALRVCVRLHDPRVPVPEHCSGDRHLIYMYCDRIGMYQLVAARPGEQEKMWQHARGFHRQPCMSVTYSSADDIRANQAP